MRENAPAFAAIAVPLVLLFWLSNSALILYLGRDGIEELAWASREHVLLLLLLFFERSLLSLPLLLLNGNLLFEPRPALWPILKNTLRLYPRYLFARAVVFPVQTILLGWTLVLPWRALVTHFFKSEVIVLERLKGDILSKRLQAMSLGQSERNIGFVLLDAVVFFAYALAMGFGFNVLLGMLGLDNRYWWLDARFALYSPIVHLLILVYCVFHTTAKFLYYIDSRSLREGWDMELTLIKGVRETEEAA